MANPWDRAKEKAEAVAQGGGDYLKMKSGQTLVGVFLGDPKMTIYSKEDKKSYDLDTPDGAKAEAAGNKPRFEMHLFDLEKKKLWIWGMSATVFTEGLLPLREKYGLDKKAVEITRKGEGKETRYNLLPDRDLTEADLAEARAAKFEEKNLSDAKAAQLIDRLKQLPRENVDAFLAAFDLVGKKVRDLPAGKVADAEAWIAEKEKARDSGGDNDPFA